MLNTLVRHKLLSILMCVLLMAGCTDPVLKPPFIIARSPEDILPLEEKWVRPVLYYNRINFGALPVDQKKSKFIEMMLPSILVVKYNLAVEQTRVGNIMRCMEQRKPVGSQDSLFLASRIRKFRANSPEDLYSRMATHPNSIVLAQAAIESGWGNSRFFKEASNVFGIWSYNASENRIMAAGSRGDKAVYLRSYEDLTGSIKDYFITLGRAGAYKNYREYRLTLKDPYKLTRYLKNYSELRYEYVAMLNTLIRENQLTQYDSLKLDPSYYQSGEKIIY